MSPDVSVVLPTRNRRDWLEEAVASVGRQTLGSWELIVVDDASDDGTAAWLASLHEPRLTVLRQEARGERARARNRGLAAARAPHVLFLDDDDRLPPLALATHVEALRAFPAAVASVGGYEQVREDGSIVRRRLVRRPTGRPVWHELLFGWCAVSGQILMRTSALRAAGGWCERDGLIPLEDHELLLRLFRHGEVALLPDLVLVYREHGGQWRPPDLRERLDAVREQVLAGEARAGDRDRRWAEAGRLARRAFQAYLDARAGEAITLYLGALRLAPGALRSSLTRRDVLVPLSKSFLGGPALRAGRRMLTSPRLRGRGPGD